MRYTTVLFDLDGTLIDTNELIIASFLHTLQKHCPGRYTRKDVIRIMGAPLKEQLKYFDPNQWEAMYETYRHFNETYHDEYTREFPHVREVVEQLYKEGVKLGVVTNKRRMMAERGLRLFGLEPWIDVLVCVDDVGKGKPDPEMIELAIARFHEEKNNVLMVGDSKNDLISAAHAGVDSVAVGWSLHKEELARFNPTYQIEDMRELLQIVGIEAK